MRIALIQESLDAARGGAERSTLEMARRLVELGGDVTLIATGTDAELGVASAFSGAQVQRMDTGTGTRAARTRRFVKLATAHCDESDYDVVHAITPCPAATVYQPRGGIYAQAIAHSTDVGRSTLGKAIRRVLRRFNARQRYLLKLEDRMMSSGHAPAVAALSNLVRGHVLAQWPVDERRVVVVFNGVELEPLPAAQREQERQKLRGQIGAVAGERVIGFMAHNFRLKGLRELLLALARLRAGSEPWRLIIAGRDNRRPFERLARKLGLGSRVHFVGPAAATSVYAGIDVLAHPTWYDPCSRVVLEALTCGVPVVTTRRNGAGEAIEPGRNGVEVESPEKLDALADGLTAAWQMVASAQQLAGAAREKLSMRRHARELMELYERCRPGRG